MSGWDDIPEEATQGGTSDWPVIPDDVYDAVIAEVGDPYDRETAYGVRKKFAVTWELSGGDLEVPVQIPQFITIPPKFVESGFLSDKSNLFKVMKALGFDMGDNVRVRPQTWVGKRARVDVETTKADDGTETSWITNVKPARQQRPQQAKAAVGAGSRGNRADGWDDDE